MNQQWAAKDSERLGALDLAVVLDHLDIAILLVNGEGHILYRNATSRVFLSEGDDLEAAFCAAGLDTRSWPSQLKRTFTEKQPVYWSVPVAGDGSQCLHVRSVVVMGVTMPVALLSIELKKSEALLEESEVARRLASLGKLAARVAHELNNPLDGILRYINLALRVASEVPESRLSSYLSESRTGVLRMIRIIADLLEFSRNSDAGFEQTGINELIEQAIKTCSAAADANRVVVTADFQTEPMPKVRGGRLYQVCSNLIRNAIDAMANGGRLNVTSGLIDDEVIIRVADTGGGLPSPVEKVFEPFYTTKPAGKGTGLGLAICKEFVEEMQGTIAAANLAAGGAVFTVRIPVSALAVSPSNIGITPC